MMRILLATDGSRSALRAAVFVARFAQEMRAAELILVNVGHVPALALGGPGAGAMVNFAGLSEEGLKRAGQQILDATARELVGVETKIITEYRRGEPSGQILEAAHTRHVDLIVMGCRGLGRLGDLILGSVSEKVLHGAHTPVLIVR